MGGGFGGVYAARTLEKLFLRDDAVEIVLISEENFLLFTPMLPEVASGSLEAKHIISPIRAFFRKAQFHNSEVERIDLNSHRVFTRHCLACGQHDLRFDHLVLALGSTTNFHGLPGVAQHAIAMKSLSDAMVLRNRIIDRFEHANMESDPNMRKVLLTFVVAGGGFAGTETVAELRDFAYTARAYYPNIRPDEVQVVLVHHGTRIMPEISEDLADYALRRLRRKGVEVRLQTGVKSAGAGWVELTTNEKIRARTLVWSAGTSPSPLLAALPCLRNKRGQVIVNEFLEVPDHPGIWALGDCAEIPNAQSGRPHPPTAQHAVRQGKIVARNIHAELRGGRKKAFAFTPIGVLASLGRRSAVAEIRGFKFSGFFAWWLWRTIYLFKLPGLERKVRVAGDWTLDLFFPRDVVLLKLFTTSATAETALEARELSATAVDPALP
ncbi:MAG: NAD(P)/FAD-dependent oxidoreductase [Acidobacteria bacterium]|nr:NAD(P)/FAD-dependent oxidoreductase [Acidobacteriota bacterium]